MLGKYIEEKEQDDKGSRKKSSFLSGRATKRGGRLKVLVARPLRKELFLRLLYEQRKSGNIEKDGETERKKNVGKNSKIKRKKREKLRKYKEKMMKLEIEKFRKMQEIEAIIKNFLRF